MQDDGQHTDRARLVGKLEGSLSVADSGERKQEHTIQALTALQQPCVSLDGEALLRSNLLQLRDLGMLSSAALTPSKHLRNLFPQVRLVC